MAMTPAAKRYKPEEETIISDTLPLEIMFDILSRLPINSLSRFRCVSKSWHNLFLDQFFLTMYAINQAVREKPKPKLILRCNTNKLYVLDYNAPHPKMVDLYHPILKPSILNWGTCKGLLYTVPRDEKEPVNLWNPVTGECRILPGFARSSAGYGLGYNAIDGDYQLVRVSSDYKYIKKHHSVVDVYSLRKNSCERISNIHCRILDRSPGVFFKGSIYWMASTQVRPHCYNNLIAYDLGRYKFRLVKELNFDGMEDTFEMNIAELGGRLCVYYSYEKFAVAWTISSGNYLTYLYKIEQFPVISDMKPLCITKKGFILLLKDGIKLIAYNPITGKYGDFLVEGTLLVNEATMYVENIISMRT